jgi:3-hydroxybutyryl-CoA dehydrogenase
VRVVGVVGGGQMGAGIAQLAAAAQLDVILADVDQQALQRGMRNITSSLSKFVKKQALSQEEADATVARVRMTTSLSDMRDVNVVIECVSENEALKKRIFGELDEILQPKAILASNTSSISITRLAAATQRPKQVFLSPSIQTLCVACHN